MKKNKNKGKNTRKNKNKHNATLNLVQVSTLGFVKFSRYFKIFKTKLYTSIKTMLITAQITQKIVCSYCKARCEYLSYLVMEFSLARCTDSSSAILNLKTCTQKYLQKYCMYASTRGIVVK